MFVDDGGTDRLVGQAYFTRSRGEVSTTFVYDTEYLAGGGGSIDPSLPLVSGSQHQRGLVRAFADSAPDRWGRNLIEKAERLRARQEQRTPRRLDDVDFLLGVSDDARQGALRFRTHGSAVFLGEAAHVPPLVSLPELLRAADDLSSGDDSAQAVKQLLDTGTTGLGGARPKASVRLDNGELAIAKFPHASDEWDVMAWEGTALDLLESAGIRTPDRRLMKIGNRSVLVLRRFDRAPGTRIGYISALTAVGANDGEHRDYAEIAEATRDLSDSPRAELRELFSRVVANVALGNTDDHLRNHGFLAERSTWTLSPAFDVNPQPDALRPRATTVMGADTPPDEAESLLAFADECDLDISVARERMASVATALAGWARGARANGIPSREIQIMGQSIRPRLESVTRVASTASV
ncbi:type II toxin-antitoxin system HipA family toxin [Microbacterium sp. CFBP 8794]|uniref:type II toxin-antitoxin system HipA family toxin n=1 Tax=Microbacterium sp. CFBP 8794 TaxID=2775269 RepID=UPI00314056DC